MLYSKVRLGGYLRIQMESLTRLRPVALEEWMILVLLLCLGCLAYVSWTYPSRFKKLFRATFNERITRQVMREEMVFSHRASILLLVVALLSWSLIGSLLMMPYLSVPAYSSFALVLGLLFSLFIVRQALRSFLRVLFTEGVGLREYNFVSALVYKVSGLLSFPVALGLVLSSKEMFRFALPMVGLLLLATTAYRWVRGFRVGLRESRSAKWSILYLCTLEILPTLVVLRFLWEQTV